MSAMANTTPIVTTVTEAANKEKTPKEADAALKVNILDFCEEHYEDILLVIMDQIHRDKRKKVHARLDFGETFKKRSPARYRNPSKRPKIWDRLRHNDENVFDRLGHRRYRSRGRGRPRRRDSSPSRDCPRNRDHLHGIKESYGNTCSSYRIGVRHRYHSRDRDRSRSMKRGRESETLLSRMSESDTSDKGHYKSKSKRRKPTGEEDLAVPWSCKEQKQYVKDPVEIHNIKQRDEETIKDFIERFKSPLSSYKEKLSPLPKRKVTHCGNHRTSPSGTFQSGDMTFKKSSKVEMNQSLGRRKSRPRKITFPPLATSSGTEGSFVIEAEIGRHMIHRMYVDIGSSTKVLYEHYFNWLRPEIKSQMVLAMTSLTGFSGETIWKMGQHRLLVIIGDAEHTKKAWMNFMIVRSLSPYNGIIGRPGIREIQSVPSIAHGMLKFLVDGGIVTIRSTILIPIECAAMTIASKKILKEAEVQSDEEKMAFHTSHGVYCYTKMPFGLKNNGATYQWLVEKSFDSQVGQNIEVYVDDLIIKSHTETEMLRDINETFRTLQKINMKLNPKKYTFGAVEELFLWYMISPKGIKPCPDKQKLCYDSRPYGQSKRSRALIGSWPLNRFISKSTKKSLPLFKTLKKCIKKSDFNWTPEAEQAFKQLKQYLSELPMLVAPKPKEELIVYMSASREAISAVLMIERDTVQTPVYFVSRALQGPVLNYTLMEKLVLSLVFAVKRTSYSVVAKFKGVTQILADFPVENSDEAPPDTSVVNTPFQFTASNNESEYEALIAGLRIATQMGVLNLCTLIKAGLGEVLKEKFIQEKEVAIVVEEDGPTWMTPIIEYLKDGTLPNDRKEVSKLNIKARQYELMKVVLYRRSFLKPWLRTTIHGGQSQAVGILLSNHASGCTGYDTQIWSFPEGTKKGQVFDSRYGLFYKVDRGKSRGDNHWQSGEEIHVGQHSMPLRPFGRNSLEQRNRNANVPYCSSGCLHNDEELRLNLDLLEERRERVKIRKAKAKLKMTKYYNARVRGVTFRPGDFVYHSNDASHAVDRGKLGPKWEGPYEVTEALRDGAYRQRSMDGMVLL
nr:reverse transcriptase domain-containing protein [Tanacetum cinerariifolium]